MALPRKQRLSRKEFAAIFKKGRTYQNDFFLIKLFRNESAFSRGAVVAPAAVFKKAVDRSKIKRAIYACLQKIFFGQSQAVDAIVIVRAGVKNKKASEIAIILGEMFEKANIV